MKIVQDPTYYKIIIKYFLNVLKEYIYSFIETYIHLKSPFGSAAAAAAVFY